MVKGAFHHSKRQRMQALVRIFLDFVKKRRKIFYARLRGEKILKGKVARVSRGIIYTFVFGHTTFCLRGAILPRCLSVAVGRFGGLPGGTATRIPSQTPPTDTRQAFRGFTHAPRFSGKTLRRGLLVCGLPWQTTGKPVGFPCAFGAADKQSLSVVRPRDGRTDGRAIFGAIPRPAGAYISQKEVLLHWHDRRNRGLTISPLTSGSSEIRTYGF